MTKPKPKIPAKENPVAKVEIPSAKKTSSPGPESLFAGVAEIPFAVLGQKKKHWNLSADEKKWLDKAVSGMAQHFGIDKIENPTTTFIVVVAVILIPRIVLDLMEANEQKRINAAARPVVTRTDIDKSDKRPAESNNSDLRPKGPGENAADTLNLTTKAAPAALNNL